MTCGRRRHTLANAGMRKACAYHRRIIATLAIRVSSGSIVLTGWNRHIHTTVGRMTRRSQIELAVRPTVTPPIEDRLR